MRKLVAEFLGSFFLLCAVVGSGIMATNLTTDVALQLLINALATIATLYVVISLFAKTSGAHFNPVVTLGALYQKQISPKNSAKYLLAQLLGAIAGTLFANAIFDLPTFQSSHSERFNHGTFLAEVLATFGLILIVNLKGKDAAVLVPAWIGGAYFFTSSTSFANPSVTIAREFTNTFSGIAPSSVLPFIAAQLIGLVAAIAVLPYLAKEKK
jgi:arsenate reductase